MIKIFSTLFLTSILLLSSCRNHNSKSSLKKVLSSHCYWDILDRRYSDVANTCYQFKENGVCLYFNYNFFARKRTDSVYLYDDDDDIRPNTWLIEGDSVFIARNTRCPVIKYTTDSIYVKWPQNPDTMILIKNCRTVREKSRKSK